MLSGRKTVTSPQTGKQQQHQQIEANFLSTALEFFPAKHDI
jgi:hypothetical protein